jgi:beta-glucanase (GH16 family)
MSCMSSLKSAIQVFIKRAVPGRRLGVLAITTALLSACGGETPIGNPHDSSPTSRKPTSPGDPVISEARGIPTGYRLVWSDEFDVAGLPDSTRWSYDTERNSAGWYNNELQYYARARAENSRVENGMLVITARREDLSGAGFGDWSGQRYSSARLLSRHKTGWTYGFYEIRAKLPCGRGTWPAIWTLSSPPQSAWPDDGEIDIMEHVGFDPGVVHGTVHTGAYNHTRNTHRSNRVTILTVCSDFHRYQLHWTQDRITVGVDDLHYFQYSNDGSGNPAWPFDSPQYLILNIAVGGDWGGRQGVDDTVFPVQMEIDYVRVYQQ